MGEDGSVSEARRRNMQAVRGKDTQPEMVVRRLLHRMGYRYRLHVKELPGKPDIVFPARRAVIEVRGCFWHRHPDPACKNAVLPATRREWWGEKLARNVARDAANTAALAEMGWRVCVVWECEVGDEGLAGRLRTFLEGPGIQELSTGRSG
jgi:DNA mismatch endonuclease Vsr